MFKKYSIATLLSSVVLFGGFFQSSVGASASAENQVEQTDNNEFSYSMNGNWNNDSWNELYQYLDQYLNDSKQEKQPQEEPSHEAANDEKQENNPTVEEPTNNNTNQVQTQPAPEEKTEKNQEQSEQLSQFEQEVVELTNQERAKQGLSPLEADGELSKVARDKSKDMSANNYFDHNSPTYGSPFDMMGSYGVTYRTAGENIAKGQRTPQEVVDGWMNSPGHRENIMNGNFTHIGVGFVDQGNHWTQMFIGQ